MGVTGDIMRRLFSTTTLCLGLICLIPDLGQAQGQDTQRPAAPSQEARGQNGPMRDAPAADSHEEIAPAARAFPGWEAYLASPPHERSRFNVNYYLKLDGVPAAGIKARLLPPEGPARPIRVDLRGMILDKPSLADMANGAQVALEVPNSGKFQLNVRLEAQVPLSKTLKVAELIGALEQGDVTARRAAGLLALGMPGYARVNLHDVTEGVAVLKNGQTLHLERNRKGVLNFVPAEMPDAVRLELSNPPSSVELAMPTTKRPKF